MMLSYTRDVGCLRSMPSTDNGMAPDHLNAAGIFNRRAPDSPGQTASRRVTDRITLTVTAKYSLSTRSRVGPSTPDNDVV